MKRKKVLVLLIIGILLFSTTGCEKKEQSESKVSIKTDTNEPAKNGKSYQLNLDDQRYVVQDSIKEGLYLKDIILSSDNTAYRNECEDENTCISYRGNYFFKEDTITINYREIMQKDEKWTVLEEVQSITYTIIEDNKFQTEEYTYEMVA